MKLENIASALAHPRYRLVEADLRDRTVLAHAFEPGARFDAIVHLAAKAGVRPSIEEPAAYQETNVAGTQNLLDLARQWGVEQFLFASSSSVYGTQPEVPWRETSVSRPISPYAATKVSGEMMGHVYSHLYGIRFLALRLFTVYGPRQRPDLAIHKFARLMLAGRPVPVYGDGSTRRDYTYVGDIVAGFRAALQDREPGFDAINLSNERTVPLIELIQELEDALGVPAKIEWLPEQPGDVPQTWGDISKARSRFQYEPRTPLRAGLRAFASWLKHSHEKAA